MKKGVILTVFLTACASPSASLSIDQLISMYEYKCFPLNEKIINKKLAMPGNKSNREAWENAVYGSYRLAKDVKNSAAERMKAIRSADIMCAFQEKLH